VGHVTVIQAIKHDLLANQAAGLPILNVMARAMINGHLQTFAPDVLTNPCFKCSSCFVQHFLHDELIGFITGIPWVQISHTIPIPAHTVPVQPWVWFLQVSGTVFYETCSTTGTHGFWFINKPILFIIYVQKNLIILLLRGWGCSNNNICNS
jgi:hypothetical protein